MRINKNVALGASFASLLLLSACGQQSGEAGASETAPAENEVRLTTDMHLAATDAVRDAMAGTFDSNQIEMLVQVAHQQAVAGHCEGFEIDQERMEIEISRLHHDSEGKKLDITADELHALEKKGLLGMGMALGSHLMIAELDLEGFCVTANEDRETASDGSHVIFKDASSEAE